jgi:histidine ammonia-lyase
MPATVVLDGQSLSLDDVVAVARERAPVELSPAARTRMGQANAIVDAIVESGGRGFGGTWGVGKPWELK